MSRDRNHTDCHNSITLTLTSSLMKWSSFLQKPILNFKTFMIYEWVLKKLLHSFWPGNIILKFPEHPVRKSNGKANERTTLELLLALTILTVLVVSPAVLAVCSSDVTVSSTRNQKPANTNHLPEVLYCTLLTTQLNVYYVQ